MTRHHPAGKGPDRGVARWARDLRRRAGGRLLAGLDGIAPHAPWADRRLLALRMYRAHGRFPKALSDPAATFNDLIYARMVSDDWTELERSCTDRQLAKFIAEDMCPGLRSSATHRIFRLTDEAAAARAAGEIAAATGRHEVAKPTHGAGAVLFLRRRPPRDEIDAFCAAAAQSHYMRSRESQYRGLERKIILEEDISTGPSPPVGYKFYCTRGEVLFCQIDMGRFSDRRRALVTPAFETIRVRMTYDLPDGPPLRPANFGEMIRTASLLSEPFGFVRVDLHSLAGAVYFGAFTFAPEGGTGTLSDEAFGQWVLQRIFDAERQAEEQEA